MMRDPNLDNSIVAYGILTDRSTLERVIGHPHEGSFEDCFVPDWTYDVRGSLRYAKPSPGSTIRGVLIDGLSGDDMRRLDSLEGHPTHYRRVPCRVTMGQKWIPTQIYQDGRLPAPKDPNKIRRKSRPKKSLTDLLPEGFSISEDGAPEIKPIPSEIFENHQVPTRNFNALAWGTDDDWLADYGLDKPIFTGLDPIRTSPPLPLFAYGALTFRETLESRLGHRWRGEYRPAELHGHFIVQGWPRHLVRQSNAVAYGFVLDNLTWGDIEKIDRSEGVHSGVYERAIVTLQDGTRAFAYIAGPVGHARISRKKAHNR